MQQVRKNLITNIGSLFVNLIIGILYTPYLVRTLGTEAYGIIPLALILNQYIIILTESLTSSITRFYSIEYFNKNYKAASEYFTSSILITFILMVLVIPLAYIPISHIDSFLNISVQFLRSAKILFILTITSFFLSVISNCINITIFSDNRLDLINYAKMIRNSTKMIVNFFLFFFFSPDILYVGIAYLVSEVFVLLYSIFAYLKTKTKHISFSIKLFRIGIIRPVLSMITWISLVCFANTFIYKIDALFVNKYYGLEYTGILGSISEFGSYCISITAILGVLYRPIMLKSYSEGNYKELTELTIRGSYIVGLLSGLICAILMGFSEPILNIWLTPEIAQYWNWLIIKLVAIPFTTIGAFYAVVNVYYNKVKESALYSMLIALVYVSLSLLLLELRISIDLFLILNLITVLVQGYFLNIMIFKKISKVQGRRYFILCSKLILFMVLMFVGTYIISQFVSINNIIKLITFLTISFVVGCLALLPFLSKDDVDVFNISFPVKKIILIFSYSKLIKNKL